MAFLKEGEKCAVLLVDDHEAFRQGLRSLLIQHDDIEVIGAAGDGAQALQILLSCKPHVILLDLNMPGMNGIELAGIIKRYWSDIAIIGLCIMQDSFTMSAFLRAGATAVMSKSENLDNLHAVITRACPRRPSAA